jgi:transcriptional regulator with GAF, ATPase, and Fis domain
VYHHDVWHLRDGLCAIVKAASTATVAHAVCEHLSRSRSIVLARLWAVGDEGTATLTASAGTPSGGGSYARTDGEFREMAIADGAIAAIVATRQPLIVLGVRGDEDWLINPSWASRQGVRAFLGLPLIDDDVVVGVLAIFERTLPSSDIVAQFQLVADVAAARLAALRARADVVATPSPHVEQGRASSVMTRAELRRVERESIETALSQTGGKVFGMHGAAALLGMRPTTLASRIKALGIRS